MEKKRMKGPGISFFHLTLLILLALLLAVGPDLYLVLRGRSSEDHYDTYAICGNLHRELWSTVTGEGIQLGLQQKWWLPMTFYSRRLEIENFMETEEFREKVRNQQRFKDEAPSGKSDLSSLEERFKEKGIPTKTRVVETYSAEVREEVAKKKDPQKMEFSGKGLILKGIVEGNSLQELKVEGDYTETDELITILKSIIPKFYSFTFEEYNDEDSLFDEAYSVENGVVVIPSDRFTRINFAIFLPQETLDTMEQTFFVREIQGMGVVALGIALVGMLLLAVLLLRREYEKTTTEWFPRIIGKIPFEIPLLFFLMLLFVAGYMFTRTIFEGPGRPDIYAIDEQVLVAKVIASFGFFLFSYHGFLRLRDVVDHGFKKGFFHHTLLFSITEWTRKVLTGGAKVVKASVDSEKLIYRQELSRDTFVRFLLFLILHGVVVTFLLLILMMARVPLLLVLGIFLYHGIAGYLLWDIFANISLINETSYEIAKGNYEAKIPEEHSYFKTIAHNFNTIADNLDGAVEEAVKSARMKTELITNVSHDLKTPLTSILNYSGLMTEEKDPEKVKEYAGIIHERSLKLKKLIDDLFEVSKATSGDVKLDLEPLDFRALLVQMAGEWEDQLKEKGLQLVMDLPDEGVMARLDGAKTSRIVENLFSNVVKYALENTRVYLTLRKGEEINLEMKNVSRDPLNITAEELMSRFTRGDLSRTTEGSGLGLSIAASLTEAQGGSFQIEIDGDYFKEILKFPKLR